MNRNHPNINYLWAGAAVEELVRLGVRHFCITPGSRSSALAWTIGERDDVHAHLHFDERGAAFLALGLAKATGLPAALICTSGTAAANYLPAVVEASNSGVPMIVMTADRPPELQDCGANQTIDQVKLYGDYVRWQAQLACPTPEIPLNYVLTTVDQAVYRATVGNAGPVHLNWPFREPLAPTDDGSDYGAYLGSVETWAAARSPYTTYEGGSANLSNGELDAFLEAVVQTERGLLVVGELTHTDDIHAVENIAQRTGWPILPDVSSGLRLSSLDGMLAYYDQLLLSERMRAEMAPSTVVTLGGPVVSKRLAEAIRSWPLERCIAIADHPRRNDPSHRVTHRIQGSIETVGGAFIADIDSAVDRDWTARLAEIDRRLGAYFDSSFGGAALDEVSAVRSVVRVAAEDDILFFGNSMPVRDADMFAAPRPKPPRVFVNRGASGIDGNIATVAGLARGLGTSATAVIGDLACLHDMNSLALLRETKHPVTIVAINNDGGGIFSMLPIAEHGGPFDRFFGTPHGRSFEFIARSFELGYGKPGSVEEFEKTYREFRSAGRHSLIEIPSNREKNRARHEKIRALVLDQLETLVNL